MCQPTEKHPVEAKDRRIKGTCEFRPKQDKLTQPGRAPETKLV